MKTEQQKPALKVQMFYIEDFFLEAAIAGLPEESRNIFNECAWRKMGFVCDDGSSFISMTTQSGLRNIIITSPGHKDPLKGFKKYLRKNMMKAHLIDSEVNITV